MVNPVDCVLLDYYLPDRPGVELIDALRTAAQDPHLPIVLLTGKGDESTAVAAMQNGASDYLPKNKANEAVLTRAIGNALEKAELQAFQAAFVHKANQGHQIEHPQNNGKYSAAYVTMKE